MYVIGFTVCFLLDYRYRKLLTVFRQFHLVSMHVVFNFARVEMRKTIMCFGSDYELVLAVLITIVHVNALNSFDNSTSR